MGEPEASPDEIINELLNANAQLTMQLATANILIRKLQAQKGETNGQVQSGEFITEPG